MRRFPWLWLAWVCAGVALFPWWRDIYPYPVDWVALVAFVAIGPVTMVLGRLLDRWVMRAPRWTD
jgi:hypothetical protein